MSETIVGSTRYEGPRIDSDDPNERKLARRLRIERRVALRKQSKNEVKPQAVKSTVKKGSIRFEEERKRLDKFIGESEDILKKKCKTSELDVNTVVFNFQEREVQKRFDDGVGKESRIEEMEKAAKTAQNNFEEIAVKWSLIQKFNDPYHIRESIEIQKEKCDVLISEKDEIIAMLRNTIKKSDIKYNREQRKQIKDINDLTKKIENQLSVVKNVYKSQFNIIRELTENLTGKFVGDNYNKWYESHKEMIATEIKHSEEHFLALEDFQKKINEIRMDFREVYRERKEQLHSIIDLSQQNFEDIKSIALLNSEKLDYNYQILSRREDENLVLKGQQKRRINKLQDIITGLREKLNNYRTTTNNQIKKRTEMIQKMHRSILDIEAKADHFSKINDMKFHKSWDITRKHCAELMKKIMHTDKILHEQQMAIQWNPPDQTSLEPENNKAPKNPRVESRHTRISLSEKSENLDESYMYRSILRKILLTLSDKSGFLTEKSLKALLSHYENEEKTLVTLDNVFQALNITNKQYMDILVKHFLPYSFCLVCSARDTPEVSTAGSQVSNLSYSSSSPKNMSMVHRITYNPDMEPLQEARRGIQESKMIIEEAAFALVSDMDLHIPVLSESDITLDTPREDDADTVRRRSILKSKRQYLTAYKTKMKCQFHHPLIISCVYVLHALKEFVVHCHENLVPLPTIGERLARRRDTVSRLIEDSEIESYWDEVRNIFDENRSKVWDALLKGLKYYHEVLKERKILAQEVYELRRRNQFLKKKLARYQDRSILLPPICHKSYSR